MFYDLKLDSIPSNMLEDQMQKETAPPQLESLVDYLYKDAKLASPDEKIESTSYSQKIQKIVSQGLMQSLLSYCPPDEDLDKYEAYLKQKIAEKKQAKAPVAE